MTGSHLQSWPSVRKMTIRECCDICETGMLYDARQCDSWCFPDWDDNPFSLLPCRSNLPFPERGRGGMVYPAIFSLTGSNHFKKD